MPVISVESDSDFLEHIKKDKTTLVDFYASWCGPCRVISPKVEEMSEKYTNITFLKVNVDDLPNTAGDVHIYAMPTFQIYKSGQKLDEVVGADAAKLEAKIKNHASASA